MTSRLARRSSRQDGPAPPGSAAAVRADRPDSPCSSQSSTAARTVYAGDCSPTLSSLCNARSLSRTSCLVFPETFRRKAPMGARRGALRLGEGHWGRPRLGTDQDGRRGRAGLPDTGVPDAGLADRQRRARGAGQRLLLLSQAAAVPSRSPLPRGTGRADRLLRAAQRDTAPGPTATRVGFPTTL